METTGQKLLEQNSAAKRQLNMKEEGNENIACKRGLVIRQNDTVLYLFISLAHSRYTEEEVMLLFLRVTKLYHSFHIIGISINLKVQFFLINPRLLAFCWNHCIFQDFHCKYWSYKSTHLKFDIFMQLHEFRNWGLKEKGVGRIKTLLSLCFMFHTTDLIPAIPCRRNHFFSTKEDHNHVTISKTVCSQL